MFTGQVTHRIAADIDTERDHIVATLTEANPGIDVEVLKSFSSGYHHRNGGGDRIETDGDLPIVDLDRVRPDAQLLQALPPTGPPSPTGDRVPLTVGFGVLMMLARVVLGFVSLFALLGTGATEIAFSPLFKGVFAPLPINPEQFAFGVGATIGAFLLVYLLLAIFIYRGKSWARTWALVASTVSTAMWIVAWLVGSAERTLALNLWGAAAEITVLLALSSDAAREFVTARLRRPLRTRGEVTGRRRSRPPGTAGSTARRAGRSPAVGSPGSWSPAPGPASGTRVGWGSASSPPASPLIGPVNSGFTFRSARAAASRSARA